MKQRIVTGALAGLVFIAVMILGGSYYTALLLLLALIGLFEFVRMNGMSWSNPLSIIGFIGVVMMIVPVDSVLNIDWLSLSTIMWLLMFFMFSITVISKNKITIDHVALTFIGTLYIGIGFSSMNDVRLMEQGFLWSILCFSCVWASDIGAYFVGRAIGKHKLWPLISPNKTIEGAVGGIISSIGVSVLIAVIIPDFVSIKHAILVGLIAALAGQLGDLIQSAYKRVRGIKDMGTLLPGHGGVIDRCDSWLIVFPLLTLTQIIPV